MEQQMMAARIAATTRRSQLAEYARGEHLRIEPGGSESRPGFLETSKQGTDPRLPPRNGAGMPAPVTAELTSRRGSAVAGVRVPDSVATLSYGTQVLTRMPGGPRIF
jgi:hypothetical protein